VSVRGRGARDLSWSRTNAALARSTVANAAFAPSEDR
jgi:hypothetical protein